MTTATPQPPLYSDRDWDREYAIPPSDTLGREVYRSESRRDFARLIHSACFRRLAGKTQLFPSGESDSFRTRLTHSLEVAQIAKSIAVRLNVQDENFASESCKLVPELLEFAGLAHDIGHPPFGHNGELALDGCLRDLGGFEGNAQTLRLLARIEKKQDPLQPDQAISGESDNRLGLNLSYRSLAAVLKYDFKIPSREKNRPKDRKGRVIKGFYESEAALVSNIKRAVLPSGVTPKTFKTVECSIMDVADDIAYSTYDIEDSFKGEFTHPLAIISADDDLKQRIANQVNSKILNAYGPQHSAFTSEDVSLALLEIFGGIIRFENGELEAMDKNPAELRAALIASKVYKLSERFSGDGYRRNNLTSRLVGSFIRSVEVIPNAEYPNVPQLLQVRLTLEAFKKVEVLKTFAYENLIMSPKIKVAEYRGQKIIREIFEALSEDGGTLLLPDDYRTLHDNCSLDEGRKRIICDFVAGMTDRYALDFHSRLFSSDAKSIYSPI